MQSDRICLHSEPDILRGTRTANSQRPPHGALVDIDIDGPVSRQNECDTQDGEEEAGVGKRLYQQQLSSSVETRPPLKLPRPGDDTPLLDAASCQDPWAISKPETAKL